MLPARYHSCIFHSPIPLVEYYIYYLHTNPNQIKSNQTMNTSKPTLPSPTPSSDATPHHPFPNRTNQATSHTPHFRTRAQPGTSAHPPSNSAPPAWPQATPSACPWRGPTRPITFDALPQPSRTRGLGRASGWAEMVLGDVRCHAIYGPVVLQGYGWMHVPGWMYGWMKLGEAGHVGRVNRRDG